MLACPRLLGAWARVEHQVEGMQQDKTSRITDVLALEIYFGEISLAVDLPQQLSGLDFLGLS